MLVATALNLVIVIFGSWFAVGTFTFKPALDWYDPKYLHFYRGYNATLLSCFETLMSVGFLWMIR